MAEGKGLLDFISSPAGQGLLAAGFGALAGRGTRTQAIGQGGLAGLLAYGQAQGNQADMARQKTQDAWMQTQRDWMSQDRARQEADRAKRETFMNDAFAPKPMMQQSAAPDPQNDYTNPDFLFQAGKSATTPIAGMGSIPMGVRPVDPMAALRSGFGVDEAMQLEKLTKPRAPNLQTFKPGEIVRNMDTGQVVFQAPEKASPTELTRMVQEMNALPPNDPMRNVYAQAIRKQTTHAPGTNVNLAVNTEKSLLNTMAQGLGNQLDNSLAGARSAVNTINTAGKIRELVGSGNVIVGPGADYRVALARIGDVLGVAGKDNAEKLANTAGLIQSLAQSELEAAQGMKGQGQITEAEREILRRAASGNFNMSAPELISLSNAMEKVGQSRIKSHQAQVQRLNSLPGAAPLVPFYSVEAPQEAAAPAPTGANDLAAAARAELERRRKGQ